MDPIAQRWLILLRSMERPFRAAVLRIRQSPPPNVYVPTETGWTFSGGAGVQANGSAWGAPVAPDGDQTAFIQNTITQHNGPSTISKVVTLPAGNHVLSFYAAQRPIQNSGPQSLHVSLQPVAAPVPSLAGLQNVSTRGYIQHGENVMIGGFILTAAPPRRSCFAASARRSLNMASREHSPLPL